MSHTHRTQTAILGGWFSEGGSSKSLAEGNQVTNTGMKEVAQANNGRTYSTVNTS
jgi:hypothetical protein